MQSYNGTGTNHRTDSGFNNSDYYTIQNMKILLTITLVGTAMYFLLPYIIVASVLLFDGFLFSYLIDTALAPPLEQ